ncbi:MAG: peptide chain release factor N(5)-glutamine methyltransferase [Eubacteriales bacterium]
MVTYGELYQRARMELFPSEGVQATTVARELLSAASAKSVASMIAGRDQMADRETIERFLVMLKRKLQGEPLPYILEQWDFCGMTLTVTPDVLIPRDDTMAVTELAMNKALFLDKNPRILDLCAGSGCIGLAIAQRVKDARVTLGELSPAAINVAKQNIANQKLTGRVKCVTVNALEPATKFLGTFDMIVSNPPYVTGQEMEELEPSVKDFEPHMALYGGQDGLEFYRAIVKNFTSALQPGGYICFEFGMGQDKAVCDILTRAGYTIVKLSQDSGDITRAVLAQYEKEVV